MAGEQHPHNINDTAWEKIRPYSIGEKRMQGGNTRDTRQIINGVFWILSTGAPCQDSLEKYGRKRMYTTGFAGGETGDLGKDSERWTNFYPMQNIFPLLVWKHIWMSSSNGIAGVM